MSAFSNDHYLTIQIIHLLSAITFGGVMIFEVLILESLHRRQPKEVMVEVESGIIRRARQFMPAVIILLYVTGILMLRALFPDLSTMPESSFGRLLLIKIALAGIVLVCFIGAMTLHFLGKMNPAIFKAIHLIVFTSIIGIVVLAKAMFLRMAKRLDRTMSSQKDIVLCVPFNRRNA